MVLRDLLPVPQHLRWPTTTISARRDHKETARRLDSVKVVILRIRWSHLIFAAMERLPRRRRR
jgi:hypothetical protein